ncbi:MAG TPA: ATP-binding protein [Bryobacteraceae bacterium]|nr:ATP-binding protein [Bryobacteraceae bacterium]
MGLLERRFALHSEGERAAAAGAFRGVAIDEGEVEGLFLELAADLARSPADLQSSPSELESIAARPNEAESPFERVRRVFRLNSVEWDAVVLSLAVELDHRFARLVAYLNDHVGRTRPTIGLALSLNGTQLNAIDFRERRVMRQGLLQTEGDGPVSGLSLRIAPEFLPRLGAAAPLNVLPGGVRLLTAAGLPLTELIIGAAQLTRLTRWAESIRNGRSDSPLVLAGPTGAGRATAVQAASAAGGFSVVETDWMPERNDRADLLGVAAREALWRDATLLVRIREETKDPDFTGLWAALSGWDAPVAIALSPERAEAASAAALTPPVTVQIERTTIEQREALWTHLLNGASGLHVSISDAERLELASRYDFVPGAMARAVRRAAAEKNGNDDAIDFESLSGACRAVGSASMGPIAQQLPQPYTRADLVLPQELMDELDLAAVWMRNRRRVFEEWGFGRRVVLGRGLTALFTGEPGTGKTMAAQVLARELGLDLFRVDLSRVMSKYIGETEKNLSLLFDEAHASGAILFFDEADALFGKRTEVKDAHDRYANLEIGYLLQRMEEHDGTTVLATNRIGDLDEAFTRRFHFILDFPMPRPPERLRIWEGMLPAEAEREPELDLDKLARHYEISGGEIRNSVLSAAFIAANENRPIGIRHLKRGLRRELLKTGRVLDGRQRQALDGA